jgi:hypothetical protein
MKSTRRAAATVRTTDAEIDAAIARARATEHLWTKIVGARFLAAPDVLAVKLSTGAVVELPRKILPRLAGFPAKALAKIEIGPGGATVWFQPADVGFELEELLLAAAGPQTLREAGARAMGAVSSDKKSAAARLNGKRGGRPRRS